MLPGLFITGTDTGVGKTFVTAAITGTLTRAGLRVAPLKPVATGATRSGDAWISEDVEVLRSALPSPPPAEAIAPVVLEAPLAPPVAARLDGGSLPFGRVLAATHSALADWARQGSEIVLVEGVGGLLCPLADAAAVADLALALDLPLVIVARRGLGTINHTLLTVEAAQLRGLRIAGVILNAAGPAPDGPAERTNPGELARRLGSVPILADLTHHPGPPHLCVALENVSWIRLARGPRRFDAAMGPPAGA